MARGRFLKRLGLYWSMVRYANAHNEDFAAENYAFFCGMCADVERYVGKVAGLRALDIGCGKSMWLTLLLHSAGARVTGIDVEIAAPGRGAGKYLRIAATNGPERALRSLVWDYLYARPYYRALAAHCPFPLAFSGIDVRKMSVTELEFEPASFDLLVSHEVFEHLEDVDACVDAMDRVIKPDGIGYIYIHNYASISGGHHIEWKYPDSEPSTVVPPWDHLRANQFPQIPSWINRLREEDYKKAFERKFDLLEWVRSADEGVALLTPEIERELTPYSRGELLAKGFTAIVRPRAATREVVIP